MVKHRSKWSIFCWLLIFSPFLMACFAKSLTIHNCFGWYPFLSKVIRHILIALNGRVVTKRTFMDYLTRQKSLIFWHIFGIIVIALWLLSPKRLLRGQRSRKVISNNKTLCNIYCVNNKMEESLHRSNWHFIQFYCLSLYPCVISCMDIFSVMQNT